MTDPSRSGDVGAVHHDGSDVTITFHRRFRHPPERVWAALTDPEELKGWQMAEARSDGRAGGHVELVMATSGGPRITGTILAWEPPRLYEHEFNIEPTSYAPHGERSVVRWELTRTPGGTELVVTHRRLSPKAAEGFVAGLHAFLDRLDAQLDGRPLPDWTARFHEVRPRYPGTLWPV